MWNKKNLFRTLEYKIYVYFVICIFTFFYLFCNERFNSLLTHNYYYFFFIRLRNQWWTPLPSLLAFKHCCKYIKQISGRRVSKSGRGRRSCLTSNLQKKNYILMLSTGLQQRWSRGEIAIRWRYRLPIKNHHNNSHFFDQEARRHQ